MSTSLAGDDMDVGQGVGNLKDVAIPQVHASNDSSTELTRSKIRRKRARVISVTEHEGGDIWIPAPAPRPPPAPSSPIRVPTPDKTDGLSQECTVCGENIISLPFEPPTSACTHRGEMCPSCILRFIEERILGGRDLDRISCPGSGCLQTLSYQDIWRWTRKSKLTGILERYEMALTRVTLVRDSEFRWCMNTQCQAGQVHEGGAKKPLITCHGCGSKQCFKHQMPWHEKRNCAQWEEHLAQQGRTDILSHKLMVETSKLCPHVGCGARITRISGCDSMYCSKPLGCGRSFCWQCLAPFNHHYDSCTHYSGRAGGNPAPVRRPEVPAPTPPKRSWLQRLTSSWLWRVTIARRGCASDEGMEEC